MLLAEEYRCLSREHRKHSLSSVAGKAPTVIPGNLSKHVTHLHICRGANLDGTFLSEHMADAIVVPQVYLYTCDFACHVHVLLLSPLEIHMRISVVDLFG